MSDSEDLPTHFAPEELAEEITPDEHEPIYSDIEDDHSYENQGDIVTFTDDSIQGFFEHKDSIYTVDTFGDWAATGSGDDLGYIWEISSGEKVATLNGHQDTIVSVKFSHDGSMLATGGMDGKIFIWSVPTASPLNITEVGSEVEVLLAWTTLFNYVQWLQFHPSDPVLLAGISDGTIWMMDLPPGNTTHVFSGLTSACTCGTFAGSRVLGVDEEGSMIAWDAESREKLFSISPYDGRFKSDGWNVVVAKGDAAVLGGRNGSVKVVNIAKGTILGGFEVQRDSIETIRFVDVIGIVVCGSIDGAIVSYDIGSMKVRNIMTHEEPVVSVQVLDNGPMIVSCSVDGSLRKWDVRTGHQIQKWTGHHDGILAFAITQDQKKIVTGGDDGASLVFGLE
ncbi:putative WD repeat-containing protein [Neolecta irregularis DAH-3]|uniref:Putative WD repeat-containing protein n=1 Tax=Neolecta irregularis (strain DAH-3) TaxID=1198029 RepID=A0A1U7LPN6_NEOID|nr:putative WD repeat-containing protein [Neolecta irregularis DAH-3]|eukprot:OLL24553.1 putative WD repeat-containing protein [Neolecta irregularis DAH-3]